jgi:hypothetical protein
MLVFSDFEKRMHARVLSETDACKGLFGHWYAQPERPFWRMHATDFWATDTRKLHPGRRATPLTDLTFPVEKNTFAKKKSLVSACVGQRFGSVQEPPPPGMSLFGEEFGWRGPPMNNNNKLLNKIGVVVHWGWSSPRFFIWNPPKKKPLSRGGCFFRSTEGRICPSIEFGFVSTNMGKNWSVPIKPITRFVLEKTQACKFAELWVDGLTRHTLNITTLSLSASSNLWVSFHIFPQQTIGWCCFCYFVRNSWVALLEALGTQLRSTDRHDP